MSHTSVRSILETVSGKAYLRSEDADPLGYAIKFRLQNQVVVEGRALECTLLTGWHCFAVLQHIRLA